MDGGYRFNEPDVAAESLDGELILLNFQSGYYYSIRGLGAELCKHLLAGGTVAHAVVALVERYGVPQEQVARDVRTFVETLVQERLFVPSGAGSGSRVFEPVASPYGAPTCEKFDDMADQLLLDKIDDQSQPAQWIPATA